MSKVRHSLREGNTDIRWKETGKAIMSGYDMNDLSPIYWEMKKVLGDKITMALSDVSEQDVSTKISNEIPRRI